MIPSYIVNTQLLGLNDSYWALILPGAISVYNMIIMRTNFESIPTSLTEAAEIDGAVYLGGFIKIENQKCSKIIDKI